MRDQTISMIEVAIAFTLFIGACWLTYSMQSEIDAGLESVHRMVQENNSVTTTIGLSSDIHEDVISFKGSEVLFMLRDVQQGKYEMLVDGVSFSSGMNPETSDLSIIQLDAKYQAHYLYDAHGEVVRVQHYKVR